MSALSQVLPPHRYCCVALASLAFVLWDGAPIAAQLRQVDAWVNVRSGPSLAADVSYTLAPGTQVRVGSNSGNWVEVFSVGRPSERLGYVSGELLRPASPVVGRFAIPGRIRRFELPAGSMPGSSSCLMALLLGAAVISVVAPIGIALAAAEKGYSYPPGGGSAAAGGLCAIVLIPHAASLGPAIFVTAVIITVVAGGLGGIPEGVGFGIGSLLAASTFLAVALLILITYQMPMADLVWRPYGNVVMALTRMFGFSC